MKSQRGPAGGRVSGESGFTLLEALIAVALTGMLLMMLATLTGHWIANWKAGLGRAQGSDLLGLGIDRITADLAAAEYVSLGGDDARTFFDGTESSVTFVRSAIGPNAAAGLEIVRLAETEDEQRGLVLVRSRASFAPVTTRGMEAGLVEFTNPIVLLRPPYRVSFAFAGHDRVWKDSWQDGKQLPDAVRVTVRKASSDEILPVSTATIISVNVPAECVQGTAAACSGQ
ncbi:MAG TPA: prepilin-type N-terminal cleavage/methylation domain-containing protein [Methylocella sp.]|nr:prepilin-type N-terminal cleavage/methylation domain-containing protein [Methylocella sp.]